MTRWIWDHLRGISVLFGDIAVLVLSFYVVEAISQVQTFHVAIGIWCLYAAVLFLADDLLAAKGIPINFYLLFNLAGVMAGSFLVVRASSCVLYKEDFIICLGSGAAAVGIHGAVCGYRLPKADTLLRYVDVLVIVLGFYLYALFQGGRRMHGEALGLGAAVLVLALLVVGHLRTGEEVPSAVRGSSVGSKLIFAAVSAVSLAMTALLVGAASGQVHDAADLFLLLMGYILQFLGAFFTVIGYILAKIIRFFLWLSPDAPQGGQEYMQKTPGLSEEAAEEIALLPDWVTLALGAILAAVSIAWILYQLRHVRIQKSRKLLRRKQVVRKSYLFDELAALGKRLKERLVFEGRYLICRDTPAGVFVYAERLGKRHKLRRRKTETPGGYIRRLAGILEEKAQGSPKAGDGSADGQGSGGAGSGSADRQGPGGAGRLYRLAERLDQIYYGGRGRGETEDEGSMTRQDCAGCRALICRSMETE